MTAARWLVLAGALAFPTVMTWAYFAHGGPAAKALYSGGKALQFALPLLWWAAVDRSRFRIPAPRKDGLIAGALFGLLVGVGIVILYFTWLRSHPALEPLAQEARAKTAAFGLTTPGRYVLFAVFLSFVHALLEEYYWRAFVFDELRRAVPVREAVLVSSLGFMAHHVVVLAVYFPGRFWTLALPFSLGVAAGGAAWALLYRRHRTIYPAWLSHAMIDAALMLVGYDLLWR